MFALFQTTGVLFFVVIAAFLFLFPASAHASVSTVTLSVRTDDSIGAPLPDGSTVVPGDRFELVLTATPALDQSIAPLLSCDYVGDGGDAGIIPVRNTDKFLHERLVTVDVNRNSGSGEVTCEVSVGSDTSTGYVIGAPSRITLFVKAKPAVTIVPNGNSPKEGEDDAEFLIEAVDLSDGEDFDIEYTCSRSGRQIAQDTIRLTVGNRRRIIAVPFGREDGDGDIICSLRADDAAYRLVESTATVDVTEDVPIVSLGFGGEEDFVSERDGRVVFELRSSYPAPTGGLIVNVSCKGDAALTGGLVDPGTWKIREGQQLMQQSLDLSRNGVRNDRRVATITCAVSDSILYAVDEDTRRSAVRVVSKPLVSLENVRGVDSVYVGNNAAFQLSASYLPDREGYFLEVEVLCDSGREPIRKSERLTAANPSASIFVPALALQKVISCVVTDSVEYKIDEKSARVNVLEASAIPVVSIAPRASPVTVAFNEGDDPKDGGTATVQFNVTAAADGVVGARSVSVKVSCGLGTRGAEDEPPLNLSRVVSVPIGGRDGHLVTINLTELTFNGTFVHCRLHDHESSGGDGALFVVSDHAPHAEVSISPLPTVSLHTNRSSEATIGDVIEVRLRSQYTRGIAPTLTVPWECSFPAGDAGINRVDVYDGPFSGSADVSVDSLSDVIARFQVVELGNNPGSGLFTCAISSHRDSRAVYIDDSFSVPIASPPSLSISAADSRAYADVSARFTVDVSDPLSRGEITARISCRYDDGKDASTGLYGGFLVIPSGHRSVDFVADLSSGEPEQILTCTIQEGRTYALLSSSDSVTLVNPVTRPVVSVRSERDSIGKDQIGKDKGAVFVIRGVNVPTEGLTVPMYCYTQSVNAEEPAPSVRIPSTPGGISEVRMRIGVNGTIGSSGNHYVFCFVEESDQYTTNVNIGRASVRVTYGDGVCGSGETHCATGTPKWDGSAYYCEGFGGGDDSDTCVADDAGEGDGSVGACASTVVSLADIEGQESSVSSGGTVRFYVRSTVPDDPDCFPEVSIRCQTDGTAHFTAEDGEEVTEKDILIPLTSDSRQTTDDGTRYAFDEVTSEPVFGGEEGGSVSCGFNDSDHYTSGAIVQPFSVEADPSDTGEVVLPCNRNWFADNSNKYCGEGWSIAGGPDPVASDSGTGFQYEWSCRSPGDVRGCDLQVDGAISVDIGVGDISASGFYSGTKGVVSSGLNGKDASIEDFTTATVPIYVSTTTQSRSFPHDIIVTVLCQFHKSGFDTATVDDERLLTIPTGAYRSESHVINIVSSRYSEGATLTCEIKDDERSPYAIVPGIKSRIDVDINGGYLGKFKNPFEPCWIAFLDESGEIGHAGFGLYDESKQCRHEWNKCNIGSTATGLDGGCFSIDDIRKLTVYRVNAEEGEPQPPLFCGGYELSGSPSYDSGRLQPKMVSYDAIDAEIPPYFSFVIPDVGPGTLSCQKFKKFYASGYEGMLRPHKGVGDQFQTVPQTTRAFFDRMQKNYLNNPFLHGFSKSIKNLTIEKKKGNDECRFVNRANNALLFVNRGSHTVDPNCRNSIYSTPGIPMQYPSKIAYFSDHAGDVNILDGEVIEHVREELIMAVSFVEGGDEVRNNVRVACYDLTGKKLLFDSKDPGDPEDHEDVSLFNFPQTGPNGVNLPSLFEEFEINFNSGRAVDSVANEFQHGYLRLVQIVESLVYDALNRNAFIELYSRGERYGKETNPHASDVAIGGTEGKKRYELFRILKRLRFSRGQDKTELYLKDARKGDIGFKDDEVRHRSSDATNILGNLFKTYVRAQVYSAITAIAAVSIVATFPVSIPVTLTAAAVIGAGVGAASAVVQSEIGGEGPFSPVLAEVSGEDGSGGRNFDRIQQALLGRTDKNVFIVKIPRSNLGLDLESHERKEVICKLIPDGYHVYENKAQDMYASIKFTLGPVDTNVSGVDKFLGTYYFGKPPNFCKKYGTRLRTLSGFCEQGWCYKPIQPSRYDIEESKMRWQCTTDNVVSSGESGRSGSYSVGRLVGTVGKCWDELSLAEQTNCANDGQCFDSEAHVADCSREITDHPEINLFGKAYKSKSGQCYESFDDSFSKRLANCGEVEGKAGDDGGLISELSISDFNQAVVEVWAKLDSKYPSYVPFYLTCSFSQEEEILSQKVSVVQVFPGAEQVVPGAEGVLVDVLYIDSEKYPFGDTEITCKVDDEPNCLLSNDKNYCEIFRKSALRGRPGIVDNTLNINIGNSQGVPENFAIEEISAEPSGTLCGGTISLFAKIQNNGDTALLPKTLRFERNNKKIKEKRTGTVEPEGSMVVTTTISAPTVSRETTHHYHACIEDQCTDDPARVTVLFTEECGRTCNEICTEHVGEIGPCTANPDACGDFNACVDFCQGLQILEDSDCSYGCRTDTEIVFGGDRCEEICTPRLNTEADGADGEGDEDADGGDEVSIRFVTDGDRSIYNQEDTVTVRQEETGLLQYEVRRDESNQWPRLRVPIVMDFNKIVPEKHKIPYFSCQFDGEVVAVKENYETSEEGREHQVGFGLFLQEFFTSESEAGAGYVAELHGGVYDLTCSFEGGNTITAEVHFNESEAVDLRLSSNPDAVRATSVTLEWGAVAAEGEQYRVFGYLGAECNHAAYDIGIHYTPDTAFTVGRLNPNSTYSFLVDVVPVPLPPELGFSIESEPYLATSSECLTVTTGQP